MNSLKLSRLLMLLSIVFCVSFSLDAQIVISEFEPNPDGADPSMVSFEIIGGAPGTTFDLWVLSIENDGLDGTIDRVNNITGAFDAAGRAVSLISDFENPSFTVILTDAFTGMQGDDIDPSNDGNLDLASLGNILDALGVSDSSADDPTMYGDNPQLGGNNILNTGAGEPELVFRDGTTGAWYAVDEIPPSTGPLMVYDAMGNLISSSTSDWDLDPTITTFGGVNPSLFMNDVVISEFEPNPDGADPSMVSFEIIGGAPGTTFDLWVLSIENDGLDGTIDRVNNITGAFDAAGRAVSLISDFENPSFTVILTDAFTGMQGDDIDPSNDGNLDLASLGNILDALGVSDSSADDPTMYGDNPQLGGNNILNTGAGEPELVFRDGTTGAWYAVDEIPPSTGPLMVYDAMGNLISSSTSDWDLDPTITTFGSVNPSLSVNSMVDITFQVNMSNETVAPDGVFIAGSFNGFTGQPMTDLGGGIWEITLSLDPSTSYQYKFQNGLGGWELGNTLAPCGVDDGLGGFNRLLVTATTDETLPLVCFNSCDECLPPIDVTFQVNMQNQIVDPSGLYIAGNFNGFTGQAMTNLGNDIWSITLTLMPNAPYQFKFQNGFGNFESGASLSACGQDDGFGGFNRLLTTSTSNETYGPVCYESCIDCTCDVSFDYGSSQFCVGSGEVLVMNNLDGGTFSYMGTGNLDLDPTTGTINVDNSDPGNYTVTNAVNESGTSPALIITGAFDGPLSGGTPKGVELFVLTDIQDLSQYGLGSANNGGGTDGEEFTFPAVSVIAGTYIYVASETTQFTNWFGFAPDYTTGAMGINGDDAVELFFQGIAIDVFGDINVDGSGQPWDHLDGWAYRTSNTCPSTQFNASDWIYSGINALDGETTNATAQTPFPNGSYTNSVGCMGGDACVESYDVLIEILPAPFVDAGFPVSVCEGEVAQLSASGTPGTWSGGLGTFSNTSDTNATYTPETSEAGSTVILDWTIVDPICGPVTDQTSVVVISPSEDAEFAYDQTIICPNGENPMVIHTTGKPGVFTVTGGDVNAITIDENTGEIILSGTAEGPYEITNSVAECGNLIITAVYDGPLPGGVPKGIELYALADIDDLSMYAVGSANNGGGTDGEELTLSGSLAAGDFYYISSNEVSFINFFGFAPDTTSNAMLINGDDAIELFCNGTVIDVFGNINESGSFTPWDYLDGWAYRKDNASISGIYFDLNGWDYSGPNALDGEMTNAAAATPIPIGTFSTIATNTCPPATFSVDVFVGDTEPLSVSCPGDITINLQDGACGEYVNYFEPIVIDNCPGDFEFTLLEGPATGEFLTPDDSPYTVVIFAENVETADTGRCSFMIEVNGVVDPVTSLTCNTNLNMSLDGNCELRITADMILEGGGYGCYNDYVIIGITEQGDTLGLDTVLITEVGTYEITVYDPVSGNQCWGVVNVEDKIPPVLDCPCSEPIIPLTQLTGFANTDFGSPEFARPNTFGQGGNCTSTTIADHVYDAQPFQVSANGSYTFDVSWITPPTGFSTPSVVIYTAPFDPTQPCMNAIANGIGGITVNLEAGVDYVFVFYDFQSNQVGGGDWVGNVTSNGFVFMGDPQCNFLCYEIDAILNSTAYTPNPDLNVGSCGTLESSFVDVLDINECGTSTITRTWVVSDPSGNTSTCSQIFSINSITAGDLLLPPSVVELPCGSGTSPSDIIALYDDPTTLDDFGTDVIENNEGIRFAFPYYQLADANGNLQDQPVDNNVCELYAVYTDQLLDACEPGCHGNSKVIREWTLIDWCTGEISAPYVQVIKTVDFQGPTFITKDTTVSTRPWDCTAQFELPAPWELHDACDIDPTWYVTGPAGVTITGNAEDGYFVSGAPKGVHTFTYVAEDCCGNATQVDMTVTVQDRVAPVAATKQDIVIALTPAGPGYVSSAKVFVPMVNNFSYDACTDVYIEIRRPSGDPDCGNLGIDDQNNNVTFNNSVPRLHSDDNAKDTDDGQFVKVCCEDLESATVDVNGDGVVDTGYIEVIMRVWDDANMTGVYGDVDASGLADNYNEAWAYVKVEDNLPPVIQCPADATIFCYWTIDLSTDFGAGFQDASQADFEKTGSASAISTCAIEDLTFSDRLNLDNCGVGDITRTWRAEKEDKNGNSQRVECRQSITVDAYQSTFEVSPPRPQPTPVTSCGLTQEDLDKNKPSVVGGICDVIGENVVVDTFLFEDGVCKKWIATYTYHNWCTGEEKDGGQAIFVYEDTEAPIIECRDTMYGVDANCEYTLTLSKSAVDTSGCTDAGWLKWLVTFDAWADGTVDYAASTFAPATYTTWREDAGLSAQFGVPATTLWLHIPATSSGQEFTQRNGQPLTIPEDLGGKMSNHKVTYKVTDGCHNHSNCTEDIMIADKKAPTPYCVNISTALMADPDGDGPMMPMVELWACDFNVGSFDNCSPQEDLAYTFDEIPYVVDTLIRVGAVFVPVNIDVPHFFNESGFVDFNGDGGLYPLPRAGTLAQYAAGNIQKWIPETRCSGKVFTCDDAPEAEVMMSVWDKKLNTDFCRVFVTFGGEVGDCDDSGLRTMAGNIETAAGVGVMEVEVMLDAIAPEYPKYEMTGSNGGYAFYNNNAALEYTIVPSKDGDDDNGVSTLDLVLIQRHILGLSEFTSPYNMIAADVNNTESITGADVVELRKLILGKIDAFESNTSWRFAEKAQTMNMNDPYTFTETSSIQSSAGDMMAEDFVGIKIGDVNGSVESNMGGSNVAEVRSGSTLTMTFEDALVRTGEEVAVTLTSENYADMYGYQFTLNLEGAELVDVQGAELAMSTENVAVLDDHTVTVSYASTSAETATELFTVVLRATENTTVASMLSMSSDVTRAEAYNSDLAVSGVNLAARAGDAYALGQNEPNPFKDQTRVGFTMAAAGQATFTVYDVAGRIVMKQTGEYSKGDHVIEIEKTDLGAAGVLYYQLEAGDFTATKKMIIIE